jgi:gas vesicle protein
MSELNSGLIGALIGAAAALAGSVVSGYYQTRAAHEQAEMEIIKAAATQPGTSPEQAVKNLLFWQDINVIKLSVSLEEVLKACRERLDAKNCPK